MNRLGLIGVYLLPMQSGLFNVVTEEKIFFDVVNKSRHFMKWFFHSAELLPLGECLVDFCRGDACFLYQRRRGGEVVVMATSKKKNYH
jgi:hypothetical protein